jgi:hypothetical protein
LTPEDVIRQARRVHQLTEQMERPIPIIAIMVSQFDMDRLVGWSNALAYRDAEPLTPGEVKKMWVYGIRVLVDDEL